MGARLGMVLVVAAVAAVWVAPASASANEEVVTPVEKFVLAKPKVVPTFNCEDIIDTYIDFYGCNKQILMRFAGQAEGDPERPWEQMIEPEMVETDEYATDDSPTACVSIGARADGSREIGLELMRLQAKESDVDLKIHVAGPSEEDQEAEIQAFLKDESCDILLVNPAESPALTPVVEDACREMPVVVFGDDVFTDCPVSSVGSAGGVGFGVEGGSFLAHRLKEGDNVVMLRNHVPGLNRLEDNYIGLIVAEGTYGLEIVQGIGNEGGEARVRREILDAVRREGSVDGVWMQTSQYAQTVLDTFDELGLPYPVISGVNEPEFLRLWKKNGLDAFAPGNEPVYQWRTAILAADRILSGEPVPKDWRVPHQSVRQANLDEALSETTN